MQNCKAALLGKRFPELQLIQINATVTKDIDLQGFFFCGNISFQQVIQMVKICLKQTYA